MSFAGRVFFAGLTGFDGLAAFTEVFFATDGVFPETFFDGLLEAGLLVAFGLDAKRTWLFDDLDLVFKQLCRVTFSLKGPRNILYTDF